MFSTIDYTQAPRTSIGIDKQQENNVIKWPHSQKAGHKTGGYSQFNQRLSNIQHQSIDFSPAAPTQQMSRRNSVTLRSLEREMILTLITSASVLRFTNDIAHSYETNTHAAMTIVALENNLCTVHEFLKAELLILDGLQFAPMGFGDTLTDMAMQGSIEEDIWPRFFRHFHDPISNRGFHNALVEYESCISWALSSADNDTDLNDTTHSYLQMLTHTSETTREWYAFVTFNGIGRFMHLLQDAGQPWHTRNDGHVKDGWIEYYAGGRHASGGEYSSAEDMDKLSKINRIPGAKEHPYFILHDPVPGLRPYEHFFDTGQYIGSKICFTANNPPGIAEYSNYNFFSNDTIFDVDNYPHPSIEDTDYEWLGYRIPDGDDVRWENKGYLPVDWGESWDDISNNGQCASLYNPRLWHLCRVQNLGDDEPFEEYNEEASPFYVGVGIREREVMEEYCQHLLPKAIAYCTDFANFFFRGRFGVSLLGNDESGILELTVTNLSEHSEDKIVPGIWMLLQDDEDGHRTEIPVDWFEYFPDCLAPNESFTLEFAPTGLTGQYTLLWQAVGLPDTNYTIEIVAKAFEEPSGACCLDGGGCEIRVEPECEALGGRFRGADTICEDTCQGPCCVAGNCIAKSTKNKCEGELGGIFLGYGEDCDTPCPGACCLSDSCQHVTQEDCTSLGGMYQGDGSRCENTCTGACCFEESCQAMAQSNCGASGGSYLGVGSDCETVCPEGCCGSCTSPQGCIECSYNLTAVIGGTPKCDTYPGYAVCTGGSVQVPIRQTNTGKCDWDGEVIVEKERFYSGEDCGACQPPHAGAHVWCYGQDEDGTRHWRASVVNRATQHDGEATNCSFCVFHLAQAGFAASGQGDCPTGLSWELLWESDWENSPTFSLD